MSEYKTFIFSKKTFLMLFSTLFLSEDIFIRMRELALEAKTSINVIEPFILIQSYGHHAIILPIMFIVLLSDFPRKETGCIYSIVRIGRYNWIKGEMLYAFFVGVSYNVILVLASIICTRDVGFFDNSWSQYMTKLYVEYPEQYMVNNHLFIKENTVTQGAPMFVLLNGVVLMSLYMLFITQILCLFKIKGWRKVGIIIAIVIVLAGQVAIDMGWEIRWLLPMAHAMFGEHFNLFFADAYCDLWISYLYFFIINSAMFIINLKNIEKTIIGDVE